MVVILTLGILTFVRFVYKTVIVCYVISSFRQFVPERCLPVFLRYTKSAHSKDKFIQAKRLFQRFLNNGQLKNIKINLRMHILELRSNQSEEKNFIRGH